jgi:hypothetical protein
VQRATAVEQAAGGDVDFASLWYAGVPEALIRLTGSMGGTDAVGVCTSNLRPIVEATMQAVRSTRRFRLFGTETARARCLGSHLDSAAGIMSHHTNTN